MGGGQLACAHTMSRSAPLPECPWAGAARAVTRSGRAARECTAPSAQRGISLLETLIAAGVLALGLHGALRLGLQGLQMGQETAEQLHARHMALQLLECHALPWPDCSTERQVSWQGTPYRAWLQRQAGEVPGTERLLATVQWQGVLPAVGSPGTGTDGSPPAPGQAVHQVQLWREQAAVPHWHGVSSP